MTTQTSQRIGLDTILSHTRDGVFVIDRNRRFLFFNEACERLTGYSAAEVLSGEADCGQVTDCHDEQDRPLAGLLCPATALFGEEGLSARQRMRITTRDGGHRWVETVYTRIADAGNQPEAIIGVIRDITDLKEQEEQWRKTTENLRDQVEHSIDRLNPQSNRQGREIDPAIWTALEAHDLPESVRELLRAIKSAISAGNGSRHEDEEISTPGPLGSTGAAGGIVPLDDVLADVERRSIQAALNLTNNQRSLAARLLNISRSRLYRRMDALGMSSGKKTV